MAIDDNIDYKKVRVILKPVMPKTNIRMVMQNNVEHNFEFDTEDERDKAHKEVIRKFSK